MKEKSISKEDRLREVPLFSRLDKKHVAAIARISDLVDIPRGEIVIREGRHGNQFMMILEGEAKVDKRGEVVNRLSEGDFFGEVALIGNMPRTATVTAETDLRVLVVPKNSFSELLEQTPGLWREIAVALCHYIPHDD